MHIYRYVYRYIYRLTKNKLYRLPIVKVAISVADILAQPIIGTPLFIAIAILLYAIQLYK